MKEKEIKENKRKAMEKRFGGEEIKLFMCRLCNYVDLKSKQVHT